MRTTMLWALGLCLLAPVGACIDDDAVDESAEQQAPLAAAGDDQTDETRAHVSLRGAGTRTRGTATLLETEAGVEVVVSLRNAPPGLLGVHVHERGDCSDPKAASMGKHFALEGERHGLPGSPEKHLGDLGNIAVGGSGEGRLEILAPGARLAPRDPRSFLGRALIVHEHRDTGDQPSGHSGSPIACGVIRPGLAPAPIDADE